MRCYNCKKADTKPWKGTTESMGLEIQATGQRCPNCGEITFSLEEQRQLERATAAALVERGIRGPAEFKFVRKLADLRAEDLAELLEVDPKTISRWERGEVPFPRAAAFVLGALYEQPRVTRRRLDALAGVVG